MGKQLRRNDSDVWMKENRPGCISSMFHILDYNHWHMLKKILPHKFHGGRHAKCDENLGEYLIEGGGIGKLQECRDDEGYQFVVQHSSTETNHASKRSLKKEGPIHHALGLTGRSRLWRTVSIHHLEPSDPCHVGRGTTSVSLASPIPRDSEKLAAKNIVDYLRQTWDAKKHGIFHKKSEKARKTSMHKNMMESDQLDKDASGHRLKDCVDVFDLLSRNKDIFFKILQDPLASMGNRFYSLQASNSRIRLNISGSFPAANWACRRSFKPIELKNKQNETWSLPKREKLLISAQEPKFGASKSLKDIWVADSFFGSASELVKNQGDADHLEDAKQRTEHGSLSMEANNVAETRRGNTIGQDGEDQTRNVCATDISSYEHGNDRVYNRTSFQDNSLDRYAKLFEHGFRRVGRWHHSKSLKATNKNDFLSGRYGGRTFRRNLSVPEFDFYSVQPYEFSSDAFSSEQPSRISLDNNENITRECRDEPEPKPEHLPSSTEEFVALEAVLGTESQKELVNLESDYLNGLTENADKLNFIAVETEDGKKIVQGSDINDEGGLREDMDEPIVAENCLNQEQETVFKKNSHTDLAQPSPDSVLENCFQFPHGEGLKPRRIDFDVESDALINSESRSNTNELSKVCVKNVNKDEAEFKYVRDVLELSGFTGKEYLEDWHLLDQPMSPSIFEEMEATSTCLPPDESRLSGEKFGPSCDHQLLFDLVNQALLEMYQRSFTYCPRALSYSCRVHSMPVGHYVVETAWASIRGRLSSGQEKKEQTLNDVVAGDLAKDDGWMNLQSETERLALDVENMIFHELLDKMLCC